MPQFFFVAFLSRRRQLLVIMARASSCRHLGHVYLVATTCGDSRALRDPTTKNKYICAKNGKLRPHATECCWCPSGVLHLRNATADNTFDKVPHPGGSHNGNKKHKQLGISADWVTFQGSFKGGILGIYLPENR